MIFDQLWRAERRDARARKKLLEKFQPLLDAAAKQGQKGHYAVLADYSNKSNMINEAEHLESALLVQKARRLVVALPPFPKGIEDNDDWIQNLVKCSLSLRRASKLNLMKEVRKEEMERLQNQMRWVSQVVMPIISLIGSLMRLISLIQALRK